MEASETKPALPELVDGQVCYRVQGEEQPQKIDLLVLKLACEESEREYDLQVVGGTVQYTAAFLVGLAQKLTSLGITYVTPTIAFQLWHFAGREMERLKKTLDSTPN
jgi:hypothetical protein